MPSIQIRLPRRLMIGAWIGTQALVLVISIAYTLFLLGTLIDNITGFARTWCIFSVLFFFAGLSVSPLVFLWSLFPIRIEPGRSVTTTPAGACHIRATSYSYVAFIVTFVLHWMRPIPPSDGLANYWYLVGWLNLAQIPVVTFNTFFSKMPYLQALCVDCKEN